MRLTLYAQNLYARAMAMPRRAALVCGALSALALPPTGLWPVLFITFTIFFVVLSHSATWKQGFARAWLFAFGYHVCGLYWIANSMLVDGTKFWWAIPFAVAGLPAYFALYAGLVGAVLVIVRDKLNIAKAGQALLFAALYMLAEIARSRFFTGFEWNLLASAWNNALPMLQSVGLIGAYGLSLLTVLLALSPYLIACGARRVGFGIIAAMVVLFGWGCLHLADNPTTYVHNVQLRLVQPDIAQDLKWNPNEREANMGMLLKLSDSSSGLHPSHIIWPEAAVPYVINKDEQARLAVGLRAPFNGAVITGGIWRDDLPGGEKRYSNSAVAINNVGAITARSDKFHLVPFGEYFPGREWLAAHGINVNSIAAGAKDFSPGTAPRTLQIRNAPPVGILLCYEVVFSGAVVDEANRPQWMLNLTNDAWFGTSSGPYQHFAAARLRAIEEGLPLVRVANTGISGVIDAYGRITAQTHLNQRIAIDHGLPLAGAPTPFSHYGHMAFLIILVFSTILGLFWRTK